jgi:hypothetical protein
VARQISIGFEGEAECARQLTDRGWRVTMLNSVRANNPNADLLIQNEQLKHLVQVKASRKTKGYVTGGSVNPKVVAGGPIFNRVKAEFCDFVIFLATEVDVWRYFVVPVGEAETIFRKNIDAYWGSPRLDGRAKKHAGQTDIFVGRGLFPHARIVPDQRADLALFENRWDLLNYS